MKNPPKNGGISFQANSGIEYNISNFRVLAWDADGDRHRTEERGDGTTDSLIDFEGARYSGILEAIRTTNNATAFSFKSPLLEQPMTIPAKKVSTVFFKAPAPATKVPDAKKPLVLRLHGGGSLRVESCSFSGTQVEARHAQLGALSLKRSAVESIEQFPTSAAASDKE